MSGNGQAFLDSLQDWAHFREDELHTDVLRDNSIPITGHWTIKNSLKIQSNESAIDITVSLSPHHSATSATLYVESCRSHPVTVKFIDWSSAPKRCMLSTQIKSYNGAITASLPHYFETSLSTKTGNMIARLYPHGPPSTASNITLKSLSGQMRVKIYSHIDDRHEVLRNLTTYCDVERGKVVLIYPLTWHGKIDAWKQGGQVNIDFPGVPVTMHKHRKQAVVGRGIGRTAIKGHGYEDLCVKILGGDLAMKEWSPTQSSCEQSQLPSYEEATSSSQV